MDMDSLLRQRLEHRRPIRLVETPRSSGVMLLVIMRYEGESELLLTRRQADLRNYANDWCLPGGRREPSDASLLACAWRELEEETSILQQTCLLLGELDDFYNGNGELVRPFVCVLEEINLLNKLQLQASEAAASVLFPISKLACIVEDHEQRFPSQRQPAYLLDLDKQGIAQGSVWGLTASILLHFRDVLTGQVSPLCKGEKFKRNEVIRGS